MADTSFSLVADGSGKRIDLFLSERLSLTRTKVKSMIEEGHVRLDGKPPKPSAKLRKGSILEGEIPGVEPLALLPEDIPLDILYEDPHLLAINKAKDMVVHPAPGHWSGTLVNAVLFHMGGTPSFFAPGEEEEENEEEEPAPENGGPSPEAFRPGIVHRLDKGTTGVILIAKDGKTGEELSAMFKDREIHKTYRAIVEGGPRTDEGVIEAAIGRHPLDRKKMCVSPQRGREAETGYRVLARLEGFSYMEAYPKTGRTHQIRVHFAHIGNPIVGDEAYGKRAKGMAERPLLHAYSIEFVHPILREPMRIVAPMPADMEEFIAAHKR